MKKISSYLKFLLVSHTEYNLHSPFVFNFYTKIIVNNYPFAEYTQLKNFAKTFKSSIKPSYKTGKLLFRIEQYFKSEKVVCFTNTNAFYSKCISLANQHACITNVKTIDDFLPALNKNNLILLDTLNTTILFHLFSKEIAANTIIVCLNIHSSKENKKHWETIKEHSRVKVTINLFSLGIVFFKKELSKQNFILRF